MRAVPMSLREGVRDGSDALQTAVKVVVPAAFSGIASAYILGISRAVGETMILAVAAGMQPNLTFNPLEPAATITAFIVQVALGDLPHGSIGYQTIFAAGLTLLLFTLACNIAGHLLRKRFREAYWKVHSDMRKRWDAIFALCGMAALMIGVLTFTALFVDMALDGFGRLSWDFTNYPSRRPGRPGFCRLGRLDARHAHHRVLRRAARRRRRRLSSRSTRPRTGSPTSSRSTSPTWPACLRSCTAFSRSGFSSTSSASAKHPRRRPDARAPHPAGVIVATREAIRSIPQVIREGSYALGATQWQTVRYHILPYSSAGILTGIIIGMARAIGETAPIITIGALTFIAFLPPSPVQSEPPFLSFDWLMSPFTVMPIQMFNWTSRPEAAFHANAAAAGFVLVFMTLAMNGLAIWLRYRLRRNLKW